MPKTALLDLAIIIVLGIAAQWVSWRLCWPAIVLLLLFGFAAGPVTRLLEPDALLGGLLQPIVSISVAVILFEGGLSLRLRELRDRATPLFYADETGDVVPFTLSNPPQPQPGHTLITLLEPEAELPAPPPSEPAHASAG